MYSTTLCCRSWCVSSELWLHSNNWYIPSFWITLSYICSVLNYHSPRIRVTSTCRLHLLTLCYISFFYYLNWMFSSLKDYLTYSINTEKKLGLKENLYWYFSSNTMNLACSPNEKTLLKSCLGISFWFHRPLYGKQRLNIQNGSCYYPSQIYKGN